MAVSPADGEWLASRALPIVDGLEVYRRAGELWTYQWITDDRAIELPCLESTLNLLEIYAGLDLDDSRGRTALPDEEWSVNPSQAHRAMR